MTQVAFCGLGTMGSGMAKRLLAAGFKLTVCNRTPRRAEELKHAGANIAATPAEAAAKADFVIAMVADDHASREVWTNALNNVRAGTILIDSSTITPAWVRELAGMANARSCPLLDAPVTGSRPQANNGELLFLVGGAAEVLEKTRPVLQPMSRAIVHLGPNGAGATMKLINNFLCGVQAASLAEALAWVERSGLDRGAAISILTAGAPGSPLVKGLSYRMGDAQCDLNFRLDLMMKDLKYASDEAANSDVELATGLAALSRFEDAVRKGFGHRDLSAVFEPLRRF